MSKIIGIDNMTVEAVNNELSKGAFGKSIPFLLVSLFLGWWGIPWEIIYTIQCLFDNLRGGRDVTDQVILALRQG